MLPGIVGETENRARYVNERRFSASRVWRCIGCGQTPLETEFSTDLHHRPPHLSSYCKKCRNKKWTERTNIRRRNHPEETRKNHLWKEYRITLIEYNEMFILQDGRCAICGIHQSELQRSLAVDHNHKTGKVRGLLCRECNLGLGYFRDNPDLMSKAMEYLVRP
jgi:hypothetical protein